MVRITTLTTLIAAGVLALAVPAQAQEGDTLEVYDLTTKKHLNVRSGPSTSDAVVAGLVMGETVKSMGCKDGWCQIETKNGTKGYSSNAFLKGAAMAAAAPEAAPAMEAKPAAFSMGKLTCERSNGSPTAECGYGLMRVGPGARLLITWPDASKRMFGVFSGVVTSGDGKVTTKAGADGSMDISLVPNGAASEHFVVPAGVMLAK